MALFQASQFYLKPGCNLNFLKLSLLRWVYVLQGLPFPLWPPTSRNIQLLTGFSISILSTYPNHLSLVWCKTWIILAKPSLFLNSADDFLSLRLTFYIHHTICMSVREILTDPWWLPTFTPNLSSTLLLLLITLLIFLYMAMTALINYS